MEDYQDKRTSEAKAERRSVRRTKWEYCEYLKKIGRWDEYYSCARKRRYRTRSEA